jgi:hypothetical protein
LEHEEINRHCAALLVFSDDDYRRGDRGDASVFYKEGLNGCNIFREGSSNIISCWFLDLFRHASKNNWKTGMQTL